MSTLDDTTLYTQYTSSLTFPLIFKSMSFSLFPFLVYYR